MIAALPSSPTGYYSSGTAVQLTAAPSSGAPFLSWSGDLSGATNPQTVTMTVVEADAVVRGQTASSSYKPGKLDNGRRVMLPPHIGAGTRIVVNTGDGSYVERAKD